MCVLKVFSDSDSFKEYAAQSSLPVYSVHDADEIRQPRTGKKYGVNRISFDVSAREWDDFKGQVDDAIAFLSSHGAAIRALISSHHVTGATLDFPLWSRLNDNIVNQNDHLPLALIQLCSEVGLGIEMSIYQRDAFSGTNEAAS